MESRRHARVPPRAIHAGQCHSRSETRLWFRSGDWRCTSCQATTPKEANVKFRTMILIAALSLFVALAIMDSFCPVAVP